MKVPSNQKRIFIINLLKKKIIDSALVAQGVNTINDSKGKLIFSNEVNSNCTSLGMYRIGEKYKGRFGTAYKLYGLDKTNSNAYQRATVLHGYYKVPDSEQSDPICNSLGCPMVSQKFLTNLEPVIDKSNKPILMNIIG